MPRIARTVRLTVAIVTLVATSRAVTGLGVRASAVPYGHVAIVVPARSDDVLRVTGTGLTRDQALAVARRPAAAADPLAAQQVTVPSPAPRTPAVAMTLEPGMSAWPCVRALTVADVRSVKRQDVLTDAIRPRPGYSACVWRTTGADDNGFRLAIATREEFADAGARTAAEFFALERKIAGQSHAPLGGIGDEAVIGGDDHPWLLVRASDLVITFSCEDCSRELATSIVRRALARVPAIARDVPPPPVVETGLPLPCLQVVDERAVRATIGAGFTPSASEVVSGESSCLWMADEGNKPPRVLLVQFSDRRIFADRMLYPTAVPTAAGLYDAIVSALGKTGDKVEPIPGLGQRAVVVGSEPSTLVFVQRPDGLVQISGTLSRTELIAIARRSASAAAPALGAHVSTPADEIWPAEARALDADARRLPCVQLLTPGEVTSLARPEVLVDAREARPGLTYCEWRSTTSRQRGFVLTVVGREEVAARGGADAAALFAAERRALAASFQPTLVAGVGDEALVVMLIPTQPMVVARRGDQILTLNCVGCSREDAVALARLAAAR